MKRSIKTDSENNSMNNSEKNNLINRKKNINSNFNKNNNMDKNLSKISDKNIISNCTDKNKNILNYEFFKRAYMTILMFIYLCIAIRFKKFLLISIYLIKIIAFYEVTKIVRKEPKKKINLFFSWYLLILSDLYLFRKTFFGYFLKIFFKICRKEGLIIFIFYLIGIIFFILNLKRGILRAQAVNFAVAHFGVLMINLPSYCIIRNILCDKFWFLFPVLLVASNDISAYIFGKLFGKTPLLKISPKKTVEGFLSAFLFTTIIGFFLAYLKINTNFLDNGNEKDILLFPITKYKIPILYFHSAIFIFFSSFLAPFGGFIASTFKRIFKIKDFASYLPGHGGITDRIDCQLLMGIFTKYYLWCIIYVKKKSAEDVVNKLIKDYEISELREIVSRMNDFLSNSE